MVATVVNVDVLAGAFTAENLLRLGGLWIAFKIARYLYRLSPFHPLSHIPGPRLAAMTLLFEFYYDFILRGRYTQKIGELHKQYGPVIRIGPDELHCIDLGFYDEIYASGNRKRDKQLHYLGFIAGINRVSTFGAVHHDRHRVLRAGVNKFFSKGQISKLEPELKTFVDDLCNKMNRNPTKGAPFNVTTAFSCLTTDMITAYSFGAPLGQLASDSWEPSFREAFVALVETTFLFRFFPFVRGLSVVAPFLARFSNGGMKMLMDELHIDMPARILKTKQEHAAGVRKERTTIFTDLLDSSLPESDKTVYRLTAEGFSIVGAGTETTAWTLTVITYYVLAHPEILEKLRAELLAINPEQLSSWTALEKLPYLYGVVMEGLRLSYGETTRSPRIAPNETLHYSGTYMGRKYEYIIPPNTAIGASTGLNHHNPEYFPDSDEFIPERWTDEDGNRNRHTEKGFTSFNRGSRVCLGMNLALCEIYHITAAMALRVWPQMRLYETTIEDVKYDHDMMTPQPKITSKGVRVVMPYAG